MTPTAAELQARIDAIESDIQKLNAEHDEHRCAFRARIAKLNAERDKLADALRAVRAGLGHLIGPLGIETAGRVGEPGR